MARRKKVTVFCYGPKEIEVGSIVRCKWGGQQPGKRPRTKRGIIESIWDDGSFRAKVEDPSLAYRYFTGNIRDVTVIIKPATSDTP